MKNLLVTVFFLATTLIFAQNPKNKNVGDFNEVKVFDLIKVSLVKSDENKVMITGEDVDDVEIIIKNNTLKVRMKFDRSFDGTKTFVAVHYTDLKVIDANEGAIVVGNELITQDSIELRAQEGASIIVGLDVNTVNVRAVSGGIVETRGKAKTQDITLNTGGIYEGRDFETKNTTVKVRAAGEAEVKASDSVDARITAGGTIDIYGDPQIVTKKHTFGGSISVKND
ncbi:head GIN domain-containing protein [Olleya sp. UBA1516]|uniref:head GIN domain-containing protein n=1 Tax=Olleya sp. UBA1516 TaxID=1947013 RepID=UPI0025FCE683|nr:head GIN domain-containing protein [Olleya sp. UBA1516]|tara:strand:+ start:4791 stop:5468 length:678 start_codon:yes stop_codon:yes gene_type:complete